MTDTSLIFQLYSARNTPIAESLSLISNTGYAGVEAVGGNTDPDVFAAFQTALAATDLNVASLHIGISNLRNDISACVAMANALNCQHIVCPYLLAEERPDTHAGWSSLAQELAGFNQAISDAGISFAWHNHDFEFETLAENVTPMQVLLEIAPEMKWEIDVGWIERCGQNPVSWLRDYRDRVSAIHLKDVAPAGYADEDGWADVGHGVLNWQALLPEIKNAAGSLLIVEHDNPSDLTRFAKRSFDTVKGWAL